MKELNIPNSDARDDVPVWSRDRLYLYFQSDRDHEKGELYSYDLNSKELQRITNNDLAENGAVWSSDETKTLFTSDRKRTVIGVAKEFEFSNIDGGPSLSPNGKWVAFTTGRVR